METKIQTNVELSEECVSTFGIGEHSTTAMFDEYEGVFILEEEDPHPLNGKHYQTWLEFRVDELEKRLTKIETEMKLLTDDGK